MTLYSICLIIYFLLSIFILFLSGVYSYRICQDDAIVAKYINASYTPTTSDWTDMETCLQAGILSCTDVPGQDCPVSPDCQSGWGCEKATSWFTW